MTSNQLPSGEFFAWDSTMLKAAEKCGRYFQYKHIEGWEPDRKSAHLLFGGWYASALEQFHRLRATGVNHEEALITVTHDTLKATWIIGGSKEGEPIGHPWESFDNNKTRETLIRSIIWYLDAFREDNLETVILADGAPAVEYNFKLEVDNGIMFCGHLDRVVKANDDYYITDNKTTGGTITARFFEQFSPDTQMTLYTFAGKAIFDLPLKGVIIDGAQIAIGFTRFERGFTFRTDAQLDEWYTDAMYRVEEANAWITSGHFPMNPASCGNYGGCEFRFVCSRTPPLRPTYLAAEFKQTFKWNPLVPRT